MTQRTHRFEARHIIPSIRSKIPQPNAVFDRVVEIRLSGIPGCELHLHPVVVAGLPHETGLTTTQIRPLAGCPYVIVAVQIAVGVQ